MFAIKMFRYFCGPQHEMSALVEGDASCSLCGQRSRCFRLEYALCTSLASDAKESAIGCFECLRKGRFEFWHDTEIGLLDENGLTHVYNHNQPPPPDFPQSALVGTPANTPDCHVAAGTLADALQRFHGIHWRVGAERLLCKRSRR